MTSRPRQVVGSWSEADWNSSDSDNGNGSDLHGSYIALQQTNDATPVRSRRLQSHSRQPRKPIQPRLQRALNRGSGSSQPTNGQIDPAFIMPSMNNDSVEGAPLSRGSQIPRSRPRNSTKSSRGGDQIPAAKRQTGEVSPWYFVQLVWDNLLRPLLGHALDIFGYSFRHFIKPLLGVALGLAILAFGLQLGAKVLRSTLTSAVMGPVCLLPGSSYYIPSCVPNYDVPQANFQELVATQGKIEEVVGASLEKRELRPSFDRARESVGTLKVSVAMSDLPSKGQLQLELKNFIETALMASRELRDYDSGLQNALSQVITRNRLTVENLNRMKATKSSSSVMWVFLNALVGNYKAPSTIRSQILKEYIRHIEWNEVAMAKVVQDAETLQYTLNRLTDILEIIQHLVMGDNRTIQANQDELLASLWTYLGKDKKNIKKNKETLELLKNILVYRQEAVNHVYATYKKVQDIQKELEHLRTEVNAPGVFGDDYDLPLEYHLDLVGMSLDRLEFVQNEANTITGREPKKLESAK